MSQTNETTNSAQVGEIASPAKRVVRTGIDQQARAVKLRYENGLSEVEISHLLGTSRETVRKWLKPFKVILENPEEIKAYKAHEADILDGLRAMLAKGMFEQLSDAKRRKTLDFSRLSWSFGTIFDKGRLLRGESTQNVMTLSDLVKAAHAKPVHAAPIEDAEIVREQDVL